MLRCGMIILYMSLLYTFIGVAAGFIVTVSMTLGDRRLLLAFELFMDCAAA